MPLHFPDHIPGEMCIVAIALTEHPLPHELADLRASDFADPRHRKLWAIAEAAHAHGAAATVDAMFAAATPLYLGTLAMTHRPRADVLARLVTRVRTAADTRAMLAACNQLAHAWADDDITRWRAEIAAIAASVAAKPRRLQSGTWAGRAARYEVAP
jgi:cell pole-organizing protein PopZ